MLPAYKRNANIKWPFVYALNAWVRDNTDHIVKLFACWTILHSLLSSAFILKKQLKLKWLNKDQARYFVGPDLGRKKLQRVSAVK